MGYCSTSKPVVAQLPAIARALQPLPRILLLMPNHYASTLGSEAAAPLLAVINSARDNIAGAIAQLLVLWMEHPEGVVADGEDGESTGQ